MSDISVLNEMDQYLDECLAAEEPCTHLTVREEGPTPPKINKGGKSPSRASNSFNYRSYVLNFIKNILSLETLCVCIFFFNLEFLISQIPFAYESSFTIVTY